MRKQTALFVLLVLFVTVITGCSGGQSIGDSIGNAGAAGAVYYQEATGYYKEGVNLETLRSALFQDFEGAYNAGLNTVLDGNKVAELCFTNVADAVSQAVAGVFDISSNQGSAGQTASQAITGNMDSKAFINALSLNETYPDTKICQQATIDILRSITLWRQGNLDIARKMFDVQRTYNNFLHDTVKNNLLNDLVANHSDKLGGLGIDSKFIGFPTDQLFVVTKDLNLCVIYNQDHAGDPMYIAVSNRALGTCTLKRKAADEFMNRPFVSQETSNRIDSGVDAGAFNTVGKPTATPQ